MQVSFKLEQLALLFALLDRPQPPSLEGVLDGASSLASAGRLSEVHADLVRRGALEAGLDGGPTLTDGAAELLSVCFDADAALTVERDDVIMATAYFLEDSTTVMSPAEGEVTVAGLSGVEERDAWFLDALGDATIDEDGEAAHFRLSIDDFEELIAAASRGDGVGVNAVCVHNGWDSGQVGRILRLLAGDGPHLKTTAVRPGTPGMAITRLLMSGHGGWGAKVVMLGAKDFAELAWHEHADLLAFVRDFEDA